MTGDPISWLRASARAFSALTERRQHAQLAAVFADLDRNRDNCVSMAELGDEAPGLVAAHSLALAASVPAHRLHAALAGVTLVRSCACWVALLVLAHLLMWVAECVRVYTLRVGRPGRRPFELAPERVARHAPTATALHYDTPLSRSRYEQLKVALMTVSGLASLRLAMAFASFALGALTLNVAARVGRSARLGPALREPLVSAALACARLSLWWIGYFHVLSSGRIARSSEARILVANHVGLIEVLALYAAARCPSFVTRVENISLPLFAGVAHVSRAIVVDRELRASRERTLREIDERAREPCGRQLMVFPEGTCNNQHSLFRFNRGAFQPGLPVQPVLFHFPYTHFNPCLTGEATGGHELPGLMWRTACQLVNRMEMLFLPVHAPCEAERADPLLYAANMQALMARHLHVPMTDATLADYKALAIRQHMSATDFRPAGTSAHARHTRGSAPFGAAAADGPVHANGGAHGSPCLSPGVLESARPGAPSSKAE
ncbi:hypothetical protein KFE25_008681 [Diacronema lutheri]|uniref:Phospholipid/glycerol acyltransferase domain-containing protein n=1 Tax=Diacronema lutheri TaxID=2081491 RepID=A0A8J5Y2L5_DIALT|nr:hypothetical protein KFE25_008681 [Diacronema lutheri]